MQVNAHESIIVDSWVSRVQYNALCHVLGTGMSIHLQVYIDYVRNYYYHRHEL